MRLYQVLILVHRVLANDIVGNDLTLTDSAMTIGLLADAHDEGRPIK